ncbi:MAG: hypothetical protein HUU56_13795 [Bdellovibrionaceae bacterium]|nr:hypothetical protein [Pseudobdellovibrionaceae bacterium]
MLSKMIVLFIFFASFVSAEELSTEKKKSLMEQVEKVKVWAIDKKIIDAVREENKKSKNNELTQDKWEKLSVLDPIVRDFEKNSAAELLKTHKTDSISEIFLNSADGKKVAFLAKTTNWSHKGKPKHEQPMKGNVWIGKVEVDESSGKTQIQVSVPVVDAGKNIGSLTVGFNVSELK